MKVEFTKEETAQVVFWTQANILTITQLIQEADQAGDTAEDVVAYKQALKSAQTIYRKLTQSSSSPILPRGEA